MTTTTVHMDTTSDRANVGWIRRTETDEDVETAPITVAEAVKISGDRDRILRETAETIDGLRLQEQVRADEIETDFEGEQLADERERLAAWRESTDTLVEELAEASR